MRLKLYGVSIEASFYTVAIFSLLLILDTSMKLSQCLLCAFIHELGHIVAMCCLHSKPQKIEFRIFDIVIVSNREFAFLPDLIVTFSGPIFNLIFALLFYYVFNIFSVLNLLFSLFNLLPIESFDGGHALKLILLRKFSLKTAQLTVRVLTFVLFVPMFTLGVLVLFYTKYNYSLLMISLYLLSVLFLK